MSSPVQHSVHEKRAKKKTKNMAEWFKNKLELL